MTKEQFIKGVKQGTIDLNLTYRYFIEKGGMMPMQLFAQIFYQSQDAVFEHFRRAFQLTSVHDKNNNFIKFVE